MRSNMIRGMEIFDYNAPQQNDAIPRPYAEKPRSIIPGRIDVVSQKVAMRLDFPYIIRTLVECVKFQPQQSKKDNSSDCLVAPQADVAAASDGSGGTLGRYSFRSISPAIHFSIRRRITLLNGIIPAFSLACSNNESGILNEYLSIFSPLSDIFGLPFLDIILHTFRSFVNLCLDKNPVIEYTLSAKEMSLLFSTEKAFLFVLTFKSFIINIDPASLVRKVFAFPWQDCSALINERGFLFPEFIGS